MQRFRFGSVGRVAITVGLVDASVLATGIDPAAAADPPNTTVVISTREYPAGTSHSVDEQGNVHVVYRLPGVQELAYRRLPVGGPITTANPIYAGTDQLSAPTIIMDWKSNRLIAFQFLNPGSLDTNGTYAFVSTDHGQTWSAGKRVTLGQTYDPFGCPQFAALTDGAVAIDHSFTTFRVSRVAPNLAFAPPSNDMSTRHQPGAAECPASASDGTVLTSFYGREADQYGLWVHRGLAASDADDVLVRYPVPIGTEQRIAGGAKGAVVIIDDGKTERLVSRKIDSTGPIGPEIEINGGTSVFLPDITTDSSGAFHAVWLNTRQYVMYTYSPNGTTWTTPRRIIDIGDPNQTSYPRIAVGGPRNTDGAILWQGSGTTKITTFATDAVEPACGGTSKFVPLAPQRVFDSRAGTPAPGPKGLIAAGGTVDIQVGGVAGVPVDATAVVMNTTITGSLGDGYVTAYPAGTAQPNASNLNVPAGGTAPNLVTVPLGTGGKVSLFASAGGHLIADVAGYYSASPGASTDGRYVPIPPGRLFDTRPPALGPGPKGYVATGKSIDVQIGGVAGVPATGVGAVAINLTATSAGGEGYITAWPAGSAQPNASVLNLTGPGHTAPNLVIIPLGTGGKISLYSSAGAELLADVVGYYTGDTAPVSTSGLFVPCTPSRLFDTRGGAGGFGPKGTIPKGGTITVSTSGTNGVPYGAIAVAMNVTAIGATAPGYVTVWPDGVQPLVSSLNLTFAGETRPNAVTMAPGADGFIRFFTSDGTDLLVDTSGYFRG